MFLPQRTRRFGSRRWPSSGELLQDFGDTCSRQPAKPGEKNEEVDDRGLVGPGACCLRKRGDGAAGHGKDRARDQPLQHRGNTQEEGRGDPAGDYAITGIGFVPSTSFSPEKALAKGAFFNERVMTFKVEPGKTSTITMRPVIQKNATFLLNFFQPALLTTVSSEGVESAEVSIVAKNEKSIAWPAYTGPLKFVAK